MERYGTVHTLDLNFFLTLFEFLFFNLHKVGKRSDTRT
jgi:hypothetical protein